VINEVIIMAENITIDYGKSSEFPEHIKILQELNLLYDDDTGQTISPEGDEFIMGIYPKAQYISISSKEEGEDLPDIVMALIVHLPNGGATVILDGSEKELDLTISLADFQEILISKEE